MILFNTTFLVEKELEELLIDCIKKQYVPAVLADGILFDPALHYLHRPADADDDKDYSSFALHFYADSMDTLEQYLQTQGSKHLNSSFARLAGKLLHFSSSMECLELR